MSTSYLCFEFGIIISFTRFIGTSTLEYTPDERNIQAKNLAVYYLCLFYSNLKGEINDLHFLHVFFSLGQCLNIVFLGTLAVAFSCLLMLKKKSMMVLAF